MLGVHCQPHTHHGGVSRYGKKQHPGVFFMGLFSRTSIPSAWKEPLNGGSVALIATF